MLGPEGWPVSAIGSGWHQRLITPFSLLDRGAAVLRLAGPEGGLRHRGDGAGARAGFVRGRRWQLAPILALVGMLAFAPPSVAQTELSPEEFQVRLDRAAELARIDGTAPSPERMADLRAALGLPVEIVIGDWSVEIRRTRSWTDLSGRDCRRLRTRRATAGRARRSHDRSALREGLPRRDRRGARRRIPRRRSTTP